MRSWFGKGPRIIPFTGQHPSCHCEMIWSSLGAPEDIQIWAGGWPGQGPWTSWQRRVTKDHLFMALLLQLPDGKHYVVCWLFLPKPALWLWVNPVTQQFKVVEDYLCKGLTHNAEEGGFPIVVTITAVSVVLVERNDHCVPHILGYRAIFPTL